MFTHVVTVNSKFFRSYQPIFVITRIIGLNPLIYKKTSKSYRIKWSWFLYTCSCVIVTLLIIFAFYGLRVFLEEHGQGFTWSSTSNYFAIFDFCELELFGFYFILSQAFCFDKMVSVLEGFDKIDSVFPPVDAESHRKQTIVFSFAVISLLLFGMSFDTLTIGSPMNNLQLKDYPFYPFYVIIFGFEMKYWQLVYLLERRMKLLNRMFKRCLNKSDDDNKVVVKAIKAHDYIHDVCDNINSLFNVKVSLIILSCFLRLVTDLYMLYAAVRRSGAVTYHFLQLVWIGIHFGRLVIILEVCHMCEYQNQVTFNLVFGLLTAPIQEETKKELKNFALKLTQKKLRFSSFAISRINRSLLTTIISTITTFLIIFIQFSSA